MTHIHWLDELGAEPSGVPNVWRVRHSLRQWQQEQARRRRLTDALSASFPFRALWLIDWEDKRGARWVRLEPSASLDQFVDELSEGGWALFFFARDPGDLLIRLAPSQPHGPEEAAAVCREAGAAAAIWSWYDDTDWLVVLREHD